MKNNNYTYKLFLEKDYSAIEIVNFLYREIQTNEPKNKSLAVIEILEVFVNRLKSEIYTVKIEIEKETGKHLKSLTNQLAAAVTYLEKLINSTIAHYKNGINYRLRKLQQMRQEIAVIGMYLEV
jgi:predicted transcriptional regulator